MRVAQRLSALGVVVAAGFVVGGQLADAAPIAIPNGDFEFDGATAANENYSGLKYGYDAPSGSRPSPTVTGCRRTNTWKRQAPL